MNFSKHRSSAGSHSNVNRSSAGSHSSHHHNFIDDVDMTTNVSISSMNDSRLGFRTPSRLNNRIMSTAGSTIFNMSEGSTIHNSFSNVSNTIVNVLSEEIIETKLHPEERKFHDILQKQSILNNEDIQGNFSMSIYPDGKIFIINFIY